MKISVRIDDSVLTEAGRRGRAEATTEFLPDDLAAADPIDVFNAGVKAGIDRMSAELAQVQINLEAKP